MKRKLAWAALLAFTTSGFAQSLIRADRIGVGRIKHWDDIQNQTSSSAEILDSLGPKESTPVSEAVASGSSSPFYERRMLPETSALQGYFQQLLALSDEKIIRTAGLRLQLPDSMQWFTQTFGSQAAEALDREYGALRASWTSQFSTLLKGLRGRGQNSVSVQVVRSQNDPDADAFQRQALAAMQRPTSLYTIRFTNPATREQYIMHSFAYVDGAFRFVGKLGNLPAAQSQATPAINPAAGLRR